MAPKLYLSEGSGVVRSVLLTEAALGLTLEYVQIDVTKGEHFSPEFLKLNPLHTIPTLVDGDNVIFDSAAINIYLVEKYGKDKSLYPDDPYKKALVNELLHFVSGTFFPTAANIIKPIMLKGAKKICPEALNELMKVYEGFEKILEGRVWAAGDQVTLADFALTPMVTSCEVLITLDNTKFPNIVNWLKRVKQLPYYHRNQKGDDEFKQHFLKNLNS